jgi:hypothetical protein
MVVIGFISVFPLDYSFVVLSDKVGGKFPGVNSPELVHCVDRRSKFDGPWAERYRLFEDGRRRPDIGSALQ